MKPIRFTQGMVDDYVSAGRWDSSLISDSWDQNAALYPDSEAIVEENAKLSWKKVKRQINNIAAYLVSTGLI